MMNQAPDFRPLERMDGYLPIEDHGLIGDGSTAALVARDGSIPWLCVPRFDSLPLFCGLLDAERGGKFSVSPDHVTGTRQFYDGDSAVLITELKTRDGLVRMTDGLAIRSGADLSENMAVAQGKLVRVIEAVDSGATLQVDIKPYQGADYEERSGGLRILPHEHDDLDLQLWSSHPQVNPTSTIELKAGEKLELILSWGPHSHRRHPNPADELLGETRKAWEKWIQCFHYDGPQFEMVKRSALTLKMLDHIANGAIVAAPTSSLPEEIGGVRNWDYRYTWIRDAAFSVYGLRRIGMETEAEDFLAWVLDVAEHEGHPKVLYTIDGRSNPQETEVSRLRGYRGSDPVRWGNEAAEQWQHDVFGEILDCAYQWASHGEQLDAHLWARLCELIQQAREAWDKPDHGIWEVRSPGQLFTYSVGLCHVALDRGARLARRFDLPGQADAWDKDARRMQEAILTQGWNEKVQALTQQFKGKALDASILCLPIRRIIPGNHPKMVASTKAIQEQLGAGGGLLYRYHPDQAPDGLPGKEGAFLLCSFWLVDNFIYQGRLDEAQELYESLCRRANDLGLLPEQIDPGTGHFLGNFPQAFSHVGVLASGVKLARALHGGGEDA
jgi:alpha,alpha-trehalase